MLNPKTDADHYVVNQGHAIGDAVRLAVETGDTGPVMKLINHTTTEGDMPVDVVVGATLFRLSIEHLDRGEKEQAERATELMHALCSDETIRVVLAASFTKVGTDQGWLPADKYDRLVELTAGQGGMIAELIAKIERRP